MNYIFKHNVAVILLSILTLVSCTDLEEEVLDGVIPEATGAGASDLVAITSSLKNVQDGQARILGLGEMTTDCFAGPTRGGDWDDNAALRQMHTHTWAPDHLWIKDTYNEILTGIFNCDIVLANSGQSNIHPDAKLIKALFYYYAIDNFGSVPFRDSYDDLTATPEVYTRVEALDLAITLATEALSALPEKTADDASIANKDAARFLLAKLYLNKAVYTAEAGSTSYTFDAADMTEVINNVNAITSTLNTTGDTDGAKYWLNFAPDNNTSNEVIFSIKNEVNNNTFGDNRWHWRMGQHYNQTPGGWNGPVIVGEYYEYFLENGVAEGADPRATYSTDEIITNFGNPVGIQRGQLYAPGGTTPLTTREQNGERPLVYTKDVDLVISNPEDLEAAGFRPMKYIPDNNNLDRPENDIVIFRYADALLMRAEAALRGGSGGDAQADLDAIRSRVGLGAITANLDNVYAERARELWLEGWRRNDMIRYGTFLNEKELKPGASDTKFLLFPFPADALLNPNITQNPGY